MKVLVNIQKYNNRVYCWRNKNPEINDACFFSLLLSQDLTLNFQVQRFCKQLRKDEWKLYEFHKWSIANTWGLTDFALDPSQILSTKILTDD